MSVKTARETVEMIRSVELRRRRKRGGVGFVTCLSMNMLAKEVRSTAVFADYRHTTITFGRREQTDLSLRDLHVDYVREIANRGVDADLAE